MAPRHDYILIKPLEPQTKSVSGIILTEKWKTVPPIGTITAVGPDVKDLKVGDQVVYLQYAAISLEIPEDIDHFSSASQTDTVYTVKESHVVAKIV
jgi:co-chaperonin GroES (HSP10)